MANTYTPPNFTGNGLDDAIAGIATAVPIFTPMFLVFIFTLIFITGYRKDRLSSASGDAPLWATIAGVVTSIVALLMSMKEGLIDLPTLVIVITITIFCGIWLFASRDR